ncbi:hypothetical protein GC173_06030 [bacterium]|nr:hypothetical protein [bacterium]
MADTTSQKIAALAAKIDAQTDKARRSQVVTIVVGIVFIVLLLGYFGFMSGLTRDALEPEGVASVIGSKIKEQVEGVNESAQAYIKGEAPKILDDVITKALDEQLPAGRKALQESIKTESAKLLQKYEDEIYKGVDDTIAKYGTNIKEFAAKLKTEEGTKEFEDALYKVIEESISEEEIREDVDTYGQGLSDIADIMDRLVAGEDLSADEAALLHLLQVVRELTRRAELNNLSVDLSVNADTPGLDADAKTSE